jgi:hypothetical protein
VLVGVCLLGAARAQPPEPTEAKLVYPAHSGVYLSKKEFRFTEAFYKEFVALIQQADTLQLTEESLKLGATIKTGELFVDWLKTDFGADSAYFLNAQPQAAKMLAQDYAGALNNLGLVCRSLPGKGEGGFIVIDRLRLSRRTIPQVFAVSNQIVNRQVSVPFVECRVQWASCQTGKVVHSATIEYTGPPDQALEQTLRKTFQQALYKLGKAQ